MIRHDGSDEEILAGENWELPSSIRILVIINMKTLSIQVLKSLTFLQTLSIDNLPQIQSLLEEGLHSSSSLQSLHIFSCHQLQSLAPLPSSLSELMIHDCPNLKSLPVNGMLSSLSRLSISGCPFLKRLLKFDKGKYWPEIARISNIEIDHEYL